MDAGAGVLISKGMMEKLPRDFMEDCVLGINKAYGNALCTSKVNLAITVNEYGLLLSLAQSSLLECQSRQPWPDGVDTTFATLQQLSWLEGRFGGWPA